MKKLLVLIILLSIGVAYYFYTRVNCEEGFVDVPGGRVAYFKYSSFRNRNNVPLVVVNGGPGVAHDYLRNLSKLALERPVVFYDQLGCGASFEEGLSPELWTWERANEELEKVITDLGYDKVNMMGHSWGGALVTQYAINNPEKVNKLVLASPLLSSPRWADDSRILLNQLPEDLRNTILQHEANGTTDDEEYKKATNVFYSIYVCRLTPWPKVLLDTFGNMNEVIYSSMWGPSEFTGTGSLKDLDLFPQLNKINGPVLLTCGRYDEEGPETIFEAAKLIPHVQVKVFEKSAHVPHLEEEKHYFEALQQFLH